MILAIVVDLDDPSLNWPCRLTWLSKEEKARAARFLDHDLSRRFAAGRIALRLIIEHTTGRDPSQIVFQTNQWGRPELAGGPFFNLSHTGSLAVAAVDDKAPVGVDLELAGRLIRESWLEGFLSVEERIQIESGLGGQASLLRLWVRKEAVLKAYGRGLLHPASEVHVGAEAVEEGIWRKVRLQSGAISHMISIIDFTLLDKAIVSLARMGPPVPVRIEHWPFRSCGQ